MNVVLNMNGDMYYHIQMENWVNSLTTTVIHKRMRNLGIHPMSHGSSLTDSQEKK